MYPGNENQDNNQSKRPDNSSAGKSAGIKNENSGKKKHFKVLHEDGSLADLPDAKEPGAGALDGTVGLGQ
jgi:hypothetical protein